MKKSNALFPNTQLILFYVTNSHIKTHIVYNVTNNNIKRKK